MKEALIPLSIVFLTALILGAGLYFAGVDANIIAAVISGVFGVYPILVTVFQNRRSTPKERVSKILSKGLYLHPILVAFFILCYLQFIERTIGFFLGAAIGVALGIVGKAEQITEIVITVVPVMVQICLIFAVVFISKYASHRIKRFAFLWIIAALLINAVIDVVVPAIALGIDVSATIFATQFLSILLELPGVYVGYVWARRRHSLHIMTQLFKQLPNADQGELIDLVQTLPGVSKSV